MQVRFESRIKCGAVSTVRNELVNLRCLLPLQSVEVALQKRLYNLGVVVITRARALNRRSVEPGM